VPLNFPKPNLLKMIIEWITYQNIPPETVNSAASGEFAVMQKQKIGGQRWVTKSIPM
jgi:hypothetical protein